MKILAFLLAQCAVLLGVCPISAKAQVRVTDQWTQQVVEETMRILPVKMGLTRSDKAVVSGQFDNLFKPYDKAYFGGPASANWLTFELTNQTKSAKEFFLGTTRFEYITCWIRNDQTVAGPFISGQDVPDHKKAVPITGMSFFKIDCPPGQRIKVYLKAVNQNAPLTPQVITPFTITTPAAFKSRFERPTDYTLLFVGAAIVMLIYNFLLLIVTKVRAYLYYAAYIVCITGYILGLVPQFAYPLYGHMNQDRFPILQLATLGVVFYILVGKEAMEIKRYYPRLDALLSYVIGAQLIALLISPVPQLTILRALLNYPGVLIGYSVLLSTGILMALKKHQPGTLFLLASFIYLTGVFLYLCQLLGLVPATLFGLDITTLFQMAVSTEFALASLSLGARINEVRRRSDQEKQAILATQNESLERSVLERTRRINHQKQEIEAQRDNLSKTLTELRATQSQLIQKEKMASLGELTAGIAHEIQNPLNFVNNFSEVSAELVSELEEEQQKARRNADLEAELLNDLKQNLQKITHHGNRASSIVKGMLNHSRNSGGEKQYTDLNALCNEFLQLSYRGLRTKDKEFFCELVRNFDTTIQQTRVVPQDFGQVLLNLFNNAFYAVQEQQKLTDVGYQPTVSIRTHRTESGVEIRIRDNGTGIPDEVQSRVFQPFFTTKPTGEGTGLGLSLAYDIITKGHGGDLLVESEIGQFSEFIILLPTTELGL